MTHDKAWHTVLLDGEGEIQCQPIVHRADAGGGDSERTEDIPKGPPVICGNNLNFLWTEAHALGSVAAMQSRRLDRPAGHKPMTQC